MRAEIGENKQKGKEQFSNVDYEMVIVNSHLAKEPEVRHAIEIDYFNVSKNKALQT